MTKKDLELIIEVKEAELNGLKALLEGEEKETEPEKETKKTGRGRKATKKEETKEVEEEIEETEDYESMSSQNLYKLCCKRGISSKCKKRDKKTLIEVLKAYDAEQNSDDDWENEEEQEQEVEKDPYEGLTAKELYKMCKDRGLSAVPKKTADVYAKILKKADEEAKKKEKTKVEDETEDDDDDDWEI